MDSTFIENSHAYIGVPYYTCAPMHMYAGEFFKKTTVHTVLLSTRQRFNQWQMTDMTDHSKKSFLRTYTRTCTQETFSSFYCHIRHSVISKSLFHINHRFVRVQRYNIE